MNVSEYRKLIHEDIDLATHADGNSAREEFLSYAVGILINGEEFDDFIECHYEGITRRNGNMAFDGYAMDESDGSCCIFIVDYHGEAGEESVKSEEINAAFKKLRHFIDEATNREMYIDMKGNEQAIEFARDLFYDSESITKYRFYLITDAFNRQRAKTIKDDTIGNKTVELNVWDIERLYELVRSSIQKESVEIKLSEFGMIGIPCVKAVDYKDVIADIDIVPQYDETEGSPERKPANIVSYSSYLAVVPGQLLNDLYLEYGSKLLEGNVRSFLSVRGKVNKSIQSTIKNYPEMFFAYNNGIAATATEIETTMTADGPVITRIKDLQIVNGGQTTASIANTVLKAKKNEKVDLSHLYVPMKISVLEHSAAEHIIPKISEYSNSQNKVDASDFFSNHPFHIRMEGYSRKTAIPSINGNQFQQYWFYERTRGQYNQGKMKFRAGSSQLKQYSNKYPEKQVITMLDLAKYMEIYQGAPDVVSRGKQKMLQAFAEQIKKEWQRYDEQFNAFYYRRVVALAIIYKRTDELIKQSAWYKEKRSYKANVIAYTLSIIFYYTLGPIWEKSGKESYNSNTVVWKNIPFDSIRNFIEQFKFQQRLRVFNATKPLLDWIQKMTTTQKLGTWNVVVAGKSDSNNGTWTLPNGQKINKIKRTRKIPKEEEQPIINIGVLRDPRDILADIDLDEISNPELKTEITEYISSGESKGAMAYRDKAGILEYFKFC